MAGSNDQAYDDAYNRGFQSGFNATYHPKAGGTGQLLGKGAGQSGDYALIEESGGEAVTFDSL
jgi:hypothetical protein